MELRVERECCWVGGVRRLLKNVAGEATNKRGQGGPIGVVAKGARNVVGAGGLASTLYLSSQAGRVEAESLDQECDLQLLDASENLRCWDEQG